MSRRAESRPPAPSPRHREGIKPLSLLLFLAFPLVLMSASLIGPVSALAQYTGADAPGLPPLAPYSWEEDFESGADPFVFWATNGSYTVLEKGLTTEHAHSGNRSFKIDVRFDEGSYFYWALPLARVPAEGKLEFSGHVRVGKETTGRVLLGVNLVYPPTWLSGVLRFTEIGLERDEWLAVSGDITAGAPRNADGVLSQHMPGMTKDDVGLYVDRIGLLLLGRPGERVVVYVDDLKLEGQVPAHEEYNALVEARYNFFLERTGKTLDGWEAEVARLKEALSSAAPAAGEAAPAAVFLTSALGRAIERASDVIAAQRRQGWIDPEAHGELGRLVEKLHRGTRNLEAVHAHGGPLVYYVVNPISSGPILPQDELIPGEALGELKIVATPGEYEPASFVVQTIADVAGLEVAVSDLRREEGANGEAVIPAGAVDVRVVKAWFQAGTAMRGISQNANKRVLTPELLLYDDSLVRVDLATESNFLKVYDKGGSPREVPISSPDDPHWSTTSISSIPIDALPVRDAETLLPVDIPAQTNKQFWLTLQVPGDAPPGVYRGEVSLAGQVAGDRELLATIPLRVHVLPFQLSPPALVYSIYYRGRLDPAGSGSISSEAKSVQQFWAEAANLVAHGVTRPTLYQPLDDEALLVKALTIWTLAGMDIDDLYYVGVQTGNPTDPMRLAALQSRVRQAIEVAEALGFSNVYVYGIDEARGERLRSQRAAWQAVHEAGGKVFVAGYDDAFGIVGDLLDILVWSGTLSVDAAADWHGAGKKIFSYANPQGGVEDPRAYRRNYGLLLWKAGYDGAMTYAYQHSFGSIWNDFDHPTYRDLNMTYPTVDGVIDTVQWEGFREGVDDVRYVATLERYIAEAKTSGESGRAALAREAQAFLDELDPGQDLDALRAELIEWILRLMPES